MLTNQRHLFDIPDDVAYLNCAYMSPLMKPAVEAGRAGLERKTRPWQIKAEDFFSEADLLRTSGAKLFGCETQDLAIVPSASYGVATAALNLPVKKGQEILVLAEQFPSNYYPWDRVAREAGAELKFVEWPEDGNWTAAVLRELRDGVAIAALPNVQWTSGGLLDLAKIGSECRKVGAALALDLTQSLGVYPFDVKTVQPDFAVAATYKWLLGPYSLGLLYVSPKWQGGKPLEENWIQRSNARDFSSLIVYTDGYDEGARRFDMGERANFALLPAAKRAIEQILEWGVAEISAASGAHNQWLAERARELGFSCLEEPLRAPHYLCLRAEGRSLSGLVEAFAKVNVFVSVRGSSIRITPHVYNTARDLERLVGVLKGQVQPSLRY
ncbi:MAG TPA: aminotransferase class V-fold PLP-dependent enzyme [Terriglobales bacterium]|jgi:selenocysteine lyase/cysteine desulfurase|nr:aminotransferase class V-fold PLP-dependent enzyme [Terriglobales bacterium]